MADITAEGTWGLVGLAATLGAGLFWLGHLRAELVRATTDIAALRRELAELAIEVGLLTRGQLPRRVPPESLKRVEGADDVETHGGR